MDPDEIECLQAFEEIAQQELKERDERLANGSFRPASDVIENDPSLRPVTVGLTAREIMRIAWLAREKGVRFKDFLRQIVLEKLEQLKAEDNNGPG